MFRTIKCRKKPSDALSLNFGPFVLIFQTKYSEKEEVWREIFGEDLRLGLQTLTLFQT